MTCESSRINFPAILRPSAIPHLPLPCQVFTRFHPHPPLHRPSPPPHPHSYTSKSSKIPSDFRIKYDLILLAFLRVFGGKHYCSILPVTLIRLQLTLMYFSKVKQVFFFLSTDCWLVLFFLFCLHVSVFYGFFYSSVIMKLQVNNISFEQLLIWPLIKSCEITKKYQ